MCGIVGVVGKPAKDIILSGLTNLDMLAATIQPVFT